MIVKISQTQKDYLVHSLLKGKSSLIAELEKGDFKFGKWHICISSDCADEIRDLCLLKIQLSGFDENYRLTILGEQIEELADVFFEQ